MDVFDSPLTLVHFRFWCKPHFRKWKLGEIKARLTVQLWECLYFSSPAKKIFTVWKAMVKGAALALTLSIIADCKHISILLHHAPFVMCDWPLDRRITDSLQRHQLLRLLESCVIFTGSLYGKSTFRQVSVSSKLFQVCPAVVKVN